MADNIVITAGTGTTVGADEVVDGTLGTVKVAFGKIMDGTLNSSNKLIVNSSGEALVNVNSALPAGTNAIGKLAANSGVDIGDVDVTSVPADPFGANADASVAAGAAGSIQAKLRRLTTDLDAVKTAVETLDNVVSGSEAQVDVVGALPAGTNNVGQVSVAPQTANGLSVFNATSSDGATALTNSAQAIKASAGQLYGWYIYNPNATAQFVQLYNTAAASVTVGTTNPLFMLTIPPLSAANVEFTNGITFSNAGWSCAATSTAGGNGAPGGALDAVLFYK